MTKPDDDQIYQDSQARHEAKVMRAMATTWYNEAANGGRWWED